MMRFLIGIVSGAAVVLLLVQAAGTDGRAWLRQVPDLLDELAVAAGDALALPPRPPAAVPEEPAGGSPALAVAPASPAGAPERPALPAGPAPLPEPLAVAAPEPAAGEEAAAAADDTLTVEPARQPIPRPPDPLPVDAAGEDVQSIVAAMFAAPATAGEQTVWVPFRSQMSASGFAERLSQSLDHPFRVERRGPGRYQVVFAYRDEPERQALLTEAAAVTGLPL